LSSDFKYRIENNTLIIEECPNGVLNNDLIFNTLNQGVYDSIYLNEGIVKIASSCFRSLGQIVNIHLPNSLKVIDSWAFISCYKLEEIFVPRGVEEIGEHAFEDCYNLKKITFPDNLKEISDYCFKDCYKLESVHLENSIVKIGEFAFCNCSKLEEIIFPNSLEKLQRSAFNGCSGLKKVKLSPNLTKIDEYAFYDCPNLSEVIMVEGLKEIKECSFYGCSLLDNIKFPSSLTKIHFSAFKNCSNLKTVEFTNGLEEIGTNAFYRCVSLKSINLPSSLKIIGEAAFGQCLKLEKALINDGVKDIGQLAFVHCENLIEVRLPNILKTIPYGMFYFCTSLKSIVIPESVNKLEADVFRACTSLKNIYLSKNIKKIQNHVFCDCHLLKNIVIPEGVEELAEYVFSCCGSLEEVYLPSTLKKIEGEYTFSNCKNLFYIYIQTKNGLEKIDMYHKNFVYNDEGLFYVYDNNKDEYSFYYEGEYVTFNKNYIVDNKLFKNFIEFLEEKNYIKLYYWSKKKFVPGLPVIMNMPLQDVDKFYINNNGFEWSKLVKKSNINSSSHYYNINSFFKLCYVLGVFSESTSIRDRAVKFLNDKIINKLDGDQIHSKFDGFHLDNGFNKEYAEFFIKYYNDKDFMICEDEYGEDIDLMAASYNNFKNVKEVYPNKTLHTNREADLLLPEHVINAVRLVQYDDVDFENKEFALEIGKYGYTQKQFEVLQEWYNIGKYLKEKELFIEKDNEKKGITYKLLEKNDPMCAVLGNITNCCQVLGGAGSSCVEYGMTKPNSGFITFNYKDRIIGQAWVWYDEESNTVCLDNIEVPHKYLEKIEHNKTIQKSFIECLLRIEESFKKEMNRRGLKVDLVTIGKGCNDLERTLNQNFELLKYHNFLSGYGGYSDASTSYIISKIEKNKKR